MLENKPIPRPTAEVSTTIKISLFIWMAAIFIIYLLIFSPPSLLNTAQHFGLLDLLNNLRGSILLFFQNSDYSSKIEFR